MSQHTAQTVASILADEGYQAFVQNRKGRQARIATNAPAHVVDSVIALVAGR